MKPNGRKSKSSSKKAALQKHLLDIYLLSNAKTAHRRKFLERASAGLVKAICQCADGVLRGKYPVNQEERLLLAPHKHKLRKLASKGKVAAKKKVLLQKGGFAFLAPLLAPVLSSVLGGVVGALTK